MGGSPPASPVDLHYSLWIEIDQGPPGVTDEPVATHDKPSKYTTARKAGPTRRAGNTLNGWWAVLGDVMTDAPRDPALGRYRRRYLKLKSELPKEDRPREEG